MKFLRVAVIIFVSVPGIHLTPVFLAVFNLLTAVWLLVLIPSFSAWRNKN